MNKLLMLSTSLTTPVALAAAAFLAAAAPAAAQDPFDWTGFYVGGSVGAVQSLSRGTVVYEDDTLIPDWQSDDGGFTGNIYRPIDGATISAAYLPFYDDYTLSLDDLDDWATSEATNQVDLHGTVFAGGQKQFGNVVLGAELRAGFGNRTTTFTDSWEFSDSDSGTFTCQSGFGCAVASLVPAVILLDGWSGPPTFPITGVGNGDEVGISGEYEQTGTMTFGTAIEQSFSALARVGVAVDRTLIYAVAGPTVARVSASTSASVTETGSITLSADGTSRTFVGEKTYEWSGSASDTRVGFTFGAGAEHAVTDNIVLRGELSYTNMGSISVTGTSSDTDATYTVTQMIGSAQASAGILFKF